MLADSTFLISLGMPFQPATPSQYVSSSGLMRLKIAGCDALNSPFSNTLEEFRGGLKINELAVERFIFHSALNSCTSHLVPKPRKQ